tara:strand:+ start:97 stop:1062 length:966 start_codon:yes stop_codon:yes gene_type:complete
MPNTKTIAINPDFFSVTKKRNKTKKKERKKRSSRDLKPNSIKKDLIAKIKEHQKKKEIEKKTIGTNDEQKKEDLEFANSLQDSIEYLESISKKVEREKIEKKVKKDEKLNPLQEIQIETDSIPYSNMKKGGAKPSYSQWRKTQKQNDNHKEPLSFNFKVGDSMIHNDSFEERQKKLSEVKAKFNMSPLPKPKVSNDTPSLVEPLSLPGPVPEVNLEKKKKRIKKKTRRIKRKFYLGKNKKTNSCGVLIKNKKTRKNVKKEINKLKSRSIGHIKKYLKKHNLMKIGSSIPDEVAREIYENAYLAGDVYNKNAEVLFHNYTHD